MSPIARQPGPSCRTRCAKRCDHVLTGYRLLTGGLLVKPAGAAPLSMHRDWTMLPDGDQAALNVWCPLIDVDEGNGALALLPGSHRRVPNIEAAHVRPFFADYGDLLTETGRSRSRSVRARR